MKYVLSFLIFFSSHACAQVFEWVKTHQVQFSFNPSLVFSDICTAPGGMLHVARMDSVSFLFGSNAYGIVQIDLTDSIGNTVRSVELGAKVTIHDMVSDLKGHLIIAGSFMDNLSIDGQDTMTNSGGALNVDPFLICFDSSGTLIWKRNLSPGPLAVLNLTTLSLSPTGEVYYATDDFNDGKITKLDSVGNDIGQIILNGAKTMGDFKFDPFGNIYVTGSTSFSSFSIGTFSINVPEQYMIFIARINAAGQATFVKLAHDITFQFPNVVTDVDGNAYVAGNLSDTITWGNIPLQGPDWVYDFFLVKVDSIGNFHWAKEVPNPTGGIVGDFFIASRKCIAYDPAGRILVIGSLRGSIDWGNGVLVNNAQISQSHLHTVAFDISGLTMWAKNITSTTFNEMHAVVYNNKNWYLTGAHNAEAGIAFDTITVDFLSQQNMFLAKLNNNMTTGISNSFFEEKSFLAYPNPTNGLINIPEHWFGNGIIELYNSYGQLISKLNCSSGKIQFLHSDPGLYLLKKGNETVSIVIR